MSSYMAQEHDLTYRVYEIRRTGSVGVFETVYGLKHVKSFEIRSEAEEWISDHGERLVDYTIIEVFRNNQPK